MVLTTWGTMKIRDTTPPQQQQQQQQHRLSTDIKRNNSDSPQVVIRHQLFIRHTDDQQSQNFKQTIPRGNIQQYLYIHHMCI